MASLVKCNYFRIYIYIYMKKNMHMKNIYILKSKYKSLTPITQEYCEQYWTSPGDNTQQSSCYTATYHLSRKLSNLDEPDTRDTAGEVGVS